jgi:type VI secretion system secreted protein Hcp
MKWRQTAAFLLLLWLPGAASAGRLGFLRLDGISGKSLATNHVGWMDIQSFEGVNLTHSSAASQPVASQLCVQKTVDTASPQLALDCAQGTVIKSGTLDLTSATNSTVEFLRLNLTNPVIGSVEQSGSTGNGPLPDEELCLASPVVSWNYKQFNPRTGLPAEYLGSIWDFSVNQGGGSTNLPVFVATGIRIASGVELDWTAIAGRNYRIYSVPDLSRPFVRLNCSVEKMPEWWLRRLVAVEIPSHFGRRGRRRHAANHLFYRALLNQITATNRGPMSYTFTPVSPALFFVVEQVPNGF